MFVDTSALPLQFRIGILVIILFFTSLACSIAIKLLYRTTKRSSLIKKIIDKTRLSFSALLFEIALRFSVSLFEIPESLLSVLHPIFYIIIVLTIGWILHQITYGAFLHYHNRFYETNKNMLRTQAVFLYRASVLIILFFTIVFLLLLFPNIKKIGFGLMGGAGIIGIAAGIAAKPILSNLFSGFLLAFNKTVRIGDGVHIPGTYGVIESINLTHIIIRTWDLMRVVMPISEFIEKPFKNVDLVNSELIGSVFLYCDYTVSVEAIRAKCKELIEPHPLYSGTVWKVHVTDSKEHSIEIRIILTGGNAKETFELRSYVREKLIEYLQKEHRQSLPCYRMKEITSP
ncbi:MAG: hypothetical protein S4CHLAM45_08320 [Chlamydiales bacterium]|nr:hypothetical protein [Chlamydiales bacterium]MCH9620418.1 hypothetical protein [Chlamydiales bacterium]MCH9622936.1 hypothetical protein [Chlamydiales bacterium]